MVFLGWDSVSILIADSIFDVVRQDLVKKAVSLAIARDGASGGVVRTVIVRHLVQWIVFLEQGSYDKMHNKVKPSDFEFLVDKLGGSDQEFLPWRSTSAMARGTGASQLIARHSWCPWANEHMKELLWSKNLARLDYIPLKFSFLN